MKEECEEADFRGAFPKIRFHLSPEDIFARREVTAFSFSFDTGRTLRKSQAQGVSERAQ